jgi:ketosteroid isomerase-like protein
MERDEQAIRDLIATWLAASKAGDTKTVLNLVADDVVFLVPGQRSGHTLSVLKKQNGAWVLFRDANLLSVVQE